MDSELCLLNNYEEVSFREIVNGMSCQYLEGRPFSVLSGGVETRHATKGW